MGQGRVYDRWLPTFIILYAFKKNATLCLDKEQLDLAHFFNG